MAEWRRMLPAYHRRVLLHFSLALLSSVLLALTFPRFALFFLAPIALAPLLFALARTHDAWQRAIYGWAAGILYWALLCHWIHFVLQVYGGMGVWGGWGCFVLFALYKGLHLAFFSWLAGPLMSRAYAIPAIAALWTGLERTHESFGFAWLDLGNAGISMSLPVRLAPYIGVYGISFVFAMVGAAVACVLLRRPRTWLLPLIVLVGLWALPPIPENMPATRTAVVVQPDVPTDAEWTDLLQERTEQHMVLLSEAIPGPLVIWPEMPAPLYYFDDPTFHNMADQVAIDHGYLLFETVSYTAKNQPLNSAVLLGPKGQEIGKYDKIHLVPFGEYVPRFFSFVNRITKEAGDFVPGKEVKVLSAGKDKLGVFICYESAFPDLVRQFTKKGAGVLVNLSNDGYFGHTDAHRQHLLIARMRAVENRRFLIRATNDGITAVIDPGGTVVKALRPYQELAAPVHYGVVHQTTFYARHGDWFAWGCLIVGVGLGLWNLRRKAE
ncbi:MAG TPA: apolipoprotein N-acyltransferase [Bryobacteraceae bacterium]